MSPKPPIVSVVIPNFNHAQYISDAIESVLTQTYRDFEVIVIDDGSTDNTKDVVARFGDSVNYVWKENAGLSAARNTGIELAMGEFIGVLDADDMYEPDFMSTLVPILIANPDAEAVYCGYQFVDYLNNPLPQKEARDIPNDQLFQALVDGNFFVPESILVRKRCYENVGLFDVAFRACEDMDMWLRIARRYKVLGSTRLLTRHRILSNSMSTDPTRQTQNRLAVIKKHFGSEPANESDWTDSQRRAYSQAYLASTVEYLQSGRMDSAYESLEKMVHIYPTSLQSLNTFYELACGEQPKGYRGDFASLDVEKNAQTLNGLLKRFFADSEVSYSVLQYKRSAYSNSWFALGLLSYGANQYGLARKYFIRAIQWRPGCLFQRRFFTVFLKSFFGGKILDWFRNKR